MRLLGYEWVVRRRATQDELGSMGKMVPGQLMIFIASDMAEEQVESTLLHEMIEASGHVLGLGLTEAQVCGLEVGLYGAFRDSGVDLTPLVEGMEG